jgi:hypothetical protein
VPTIEELHAIADMVAINSTSLVTVGNKYGKLESSLLEAMKSQLSVSHVYGDIDGFDPSAETIYVVVDNDTMNSFLRYVSKQSNLKEGVLKHFGWRRIFVGVIKEEGEPLSTVTDPKKIILGAS